MRSDELETLAAESVGKTLAGKWRLEALIGVGGMAAVYRARHVNNARLVAIKVLHETFRRESSIRHRFLREAKIANQVDHPLVVRFFDDGTTDDGRPFLVTDLLSGHDLEAVRTAAGGTLALPAVLEIGVLVLSVLDVAHAAGIVHRDLKPANLFRKDDGAIVILDFGLARAFEDSDEDGASASALTSADSLLGTVGFMAPEQAQGRWDLVGPSTDLFAVGATLLKLATGLAIHDAEGTHARLMLAATKPVPKTASRAPSLPSDFADVLDRALAFSQRERFESAAMFRTALLRCATVSRSVPRSPVVVGDASFVNAKTVSSSRALLVEPVEASGREQRPQKRSLGRWLVVGVVFLLGASSIVWATSAARRSSARPEPATTAMAPPAAAAADGTSETAPIVPSALPLATSEKSDGTPSSTTAPRGARGSGAVITDKPRSPSTAAASGASGVTTSPSVAAPDDPMDRRR